MSKRNYYKPFDFPWAYDVWKKHEAMHWMAHEVPMHEDAKDWQTSLSDTEQALLKNLFRFFTQADVSVAGGYTSKFLPLFSGVPELAMMMSSFAAREAVHIDAYSTLIETVGMPESTYQEFMGYQAMRDKNDYVEQFGVDTEENLFKTLAVYSAFTEGMQLFGSFVVLLNFARFNKMKNMGNIVAWSVRDEDVHVHGMTTLFKDLWKRSSLSQEKKDEIIKEILTCARSMVDMEDAFIDVIFASTPSLQDLSADQVKDYVRYVTNQRWKQLGFEGVVYQRHTKNPLPWVDYMVNGTEHANFFEAKATTYAKASTKGTMEDVQW